MTHVLIDDLRSAGVGTCQQARHWFERNGLNWRDFKGSGLPAETLRKIDDEPAHVEAVIQAAERREARNGLEKS